MSGSEDRNRNANGTLTGRLPKVGRVSPRGAYVPGTQLLHPLALLLVVEDVPPVLYCTVQLRATTSCNRYYQ